MSSAPERHMIRQIGESSQETIIGSQTRAAEILKETL